MFPAVVCLPPLTPRARRYACSTGDCAAHLEEAATNLARTAVKPIVKDNTLVAPPGADLDIFAMCEYVPRRLVESYTAGLTALPQRPCRPGSRPSAPPAAGAPALHLCRLHFCEHRA